MPIPDPGAIDLGRIGAPASAEHWLGNDALGRDLLARSIHGARVSLLVGAVSPLIALTGGCVIGLIAAFRRGSTERVALFVIDVLLAFPALVLALALVGYVGRGLGSVVLVLGFLGVPAFARVARVNAIAQLACDYCMAARAVGSDAAGLAWRHVLPNIAGPLVSFGLVASATMITAEGALGFLGLSVPPPRPSWGAMIAEGRDAIETAPHVLLVPCAMIFLTVLSLNTLAGRLERGVARDQRD
ncbi:MAG: ABC transporter permease [Gammaproteobacteria bacterium]|nr:ABC transporter permease [Gammaproteobacteria bacterium]